MNKRKYPQVLLIGNGLNRAFKGDSWENVIQKIWTNSNVSYATAKYLPFPLQIVLGTNDHVDETIKNGKEIFSTIEDSKPLSDSYKELLSVGFDHILTTNYTYELERAIFPHKKDIGQYLAKSLMYHTDAVKKSEQKYMLHTYYGIKHKDQDNKVWHIHGEVRKPDSIIIGHYYYGKLLSKYHKELEDRKDQQFLRQKDEKQPLIDSWLDAFIMGDVYIIGFGFDFSEMDMWWLLNRKKREKADCGKVYFYEPSFGNELKHELLRTYGAIICDLGFKNKAPVYSEFYRAAIKDITAKVHKREES